VLLFVGLDAQVEDESLDRLELGLPGNQTQLLHAVLAATHPRSGEGKVVVVLINGGAVAVPELKESTEVDAVLEAFYPGQAGAAAIFGAIFGEFSPAGVLPVTVYGNDLVGRRSVRCAFSDRHLHSRMPLRFTPLLRWKRAGV
jgi:hypothetical protein